MVTAVKKESQAGSGDQRKASFEARTSIRIVPHRRKKRKSFRIIAVKGLTFGAFLTNLYAVMLLEFHPAIGVPLWGATFLYILAFLKSNGGL